MGVTLVHVNYSTAIMFLRNSLYEFSLCGSAPLEFLTLKLNKIKYIKLRVGLNHHISMLSSGVYWQQPDNRLPSPAASDAARNFLRN